MAHGSSNRAASPLAHAMTPAMLVVAFVCFFAGVAVPFFNVTKMWVFEDAVSVLSGLVDLAEAQEWFLFVIIFLFTLVFPLVKLGILAAVWWNRGGDDARSERMLRRASNLGKWSMLDVFVVAVLIVAVKSASLASIHVGLGVYLFTGAVLLTQTIAIRLERRLGRSGSSRQ